MIAKWVRVSTRGELTMVGQAGMTRHELPCSSGLSVSFPFIPFHSIPISSDLITSHSIPPKSSHPISHPDPIRPVPTPFRAMSWRRPRWRQRRPDLGAAEPSRPAPTRLVMTLLAGSGSGRALLHAMEVKWKLNSDLLFRATGTAAEPMVRSCKSAAEGHLRFFGNVCDLM